MTTGMPRAISSLATEVTSPWGRFAYGRIHLRPAQQFQCLSNGCGGANNLAVGIFDGHLNVEGDDELIFDDQNLAAAQRHTRILPRASMRYTPASAPEWPINLRCSEPLGA